MTNQHHKRQYINGKPKVLARPPKNKLMPLGDSEWAALASLGRETTCKPKKKAGRVRPVDDEDEEKPQGRNVDHEDDDDDDMPYKPQITCYGQMTRLDTEWLWPGRIALGKLCVIAGHPGLGKSQLTIDIAARVSAGKAWPKTDKDALDIRAPRGDVLMMSAEDTAEDIVLPRLEAAGAHCDRVHNLEGFKLIAEDRPGERGLKSISLEEDGLRVIKKAIQQFPQAKLLVIDPVSAYCGRIDTHKNAEVREQLAELGRIANATGVAVILVSHFTKTTAIRQSALERVTGSAAFGAVARTAWAVLEDRQSEDADRRLFLPLKNNLARHVVGMAFSIVPYHKVSKLVWEQVPVQMNADEALALKPRTAADKAVTWLQKYLADKKPHRREKLLEAAMNAGFSERTIERASQSLPVKKERKGYGQGSYWSLDTRDHREVTWDDAPFVGE